LADESKSADQAIRLPANIPQCLGVSPVVFWAAPALPCAYTRQHTEIRHQSKTGRVEPSCDVQKCRIRPRLLTAEAAVSFYLGVPVSCGARSTAARPPLYRKSLLPFDYFLMVNRQ
jgi:hypothetical protein